MLSCGLAHFSMHQDVQIIASCCLGKAHGFLGFRIYLGLSAGRRLAGVAITLREEARTISLISCSEGRSMFLNDTFTWRFDFLESDELHGPGVRLLEAQDGFLVGSKDPRRAPWFAPPSRFAPGRRGGPARAGSRSAGSLGSPDLASKRHALFCIRALGLPWALGTYKAFLKTEATRLPFRSHRSCTEFLGLWEIPICPQPRC